MVRSGGTDVRDNSFRGMGPKWADVPGEANDNHTAGRKSLPSRPRPICRDMWELGGCKVTSDNNYSRTTYGASCVKNSRHCAPRDMQVSK